MRRSNGIPRGVTPPPPRLPRSTSFAVGGAGSNSTVRLASGETRLIATKTEAGMRTATTAFSSPTRFGTAKARVTGPPVSVTAAVSLAVTRTNIGAGPGWAVARISVRPSGRRTVRSGEMITGARPPSLKSVGIRRPEVMKGVNGGRTNGSVTIT